MKHIFWRLVVLLFFVTALTGCKKNGESGSVPGGENTFDSDSSYAFGMNMASDLKASNITLDINAYSQGFRDAAEGRKTRFSAEEAAEKFRQAITAMQDKQFESYKQEAVDFLAENSKKPGLVITASGLQYEVLSEGTGPKPSATDTVMINYTGALVDGTQFDSSYSRGEPAKMSLQAVIPGWTEGVQLMNVGSKYRFYIPSELGYGPQGSGPIPPYATLIFEVELLEIVK